MKTHFLIKTILLSFMLTFSVSAWADGNDTVLVKAMLGI